jgi:hypothetical protein
VPVIPPELLECSIYLYPTVEAAESGERIGGSGCLVGVPLGFNEGDDKIEPPFKATIYAVTNSHVVRAGGTVVRINTRDGAFDALTVSPEAWIHHPDGDDLAVAVLGLADSHKFMAIPPWLLVTPNDPMYYSIGVETAMVGRFVTHEGRQRNIPAVRFGNVSMLPWEPVQTQRGGLAQDSFLIEERSLSGYSGSPVFTYHTYPRPGAEPMRGDEPFEERHYAHGLAIRLLGINWGHLRDYEPVVQSDGTPTSEKLRVQRNTGMGVVVPAWKLAELLFDDEEVVQMRQESEREWLKEHPAEEAAALDAAPADVPEEFNRFEDLARKLTQVPKSELDEKRKR